MTAEPKHSITGHESWEFDRVERVREIAGRLKVSRQSVYGWLRSGALPSIRVGPRTILVLERDLSAFLSVRRMP